MKNEETIFTEALLKTSPQERAAFITDACAGDVDLRLEVEALLEAHEQRGGVLESPPAGIESTAGSSDLAGDPSEQVGAVVGHYKLLQQIGEGGMGVVFMAEQLEPVRRRVAVKIIKPGLDTKQVIARFEAERQALAMMDHPNIAKVLDAGATDAGRPYFVMELVKGIPITEYCDQQQLNPRERLALFIQVCQAVQHAHTKGIIHRDLKPTNVLVTLNDGHPAPKIIDFGIAKATAGERLTDRTLFTEFRQLIGTPLYMSPEQAEMSVLMDVDTRSDVYSLGVLLYELLTGTTPFDKQRLAKAAFEEVRRILREEEPPRLSTRLSTLGETLATISASRSSDPKRLGQLMRGELDWIAMKALEKDRDRRYGTPSDLARDVERYLADQPVEACPPARLYRFRKMVRRNKAAITTAAVLGMVLLLATGFSTWQAVLASRATAAAKIDRDLAVAEKGKAIAEKQRAKELDAVTDAINEFLNKDVLGQASPYDQPGQESAPNRDLKVRDALDRAAARITGRFEIEPLVEANVHSTIGMAYFGLGEYEKAEQHLQATLDLQRKFDRLEDADYRRSIISNLASVYLFSEQYPKAEQLIMPEWKKLRETLGDDAPETVWWAGLVGKMYEREAQYAKAEPLLVQVLAAERRLGGDKDARTRDTANNLAQVYHALGDDANAVRLSLEAYDASRAAEGPHSLNTIKLLYNLAVNYKEQRRYDKAEAMLLDVVKGYHDVWGDENVDTLTANLELGIVYREEGRLEKAEPLIQKSVAAMRTVLGEKNRLTLEAQDDLAGLYVRKEQFDKALALFLEVLETERKELGENDRATWRTGHHLGALYMRLHQFDKAEAVMLRNLQIARKIFGEREYKRFVSAGSLAAVYLSIGSYERAEPLYREELEGRKARGVTDPEIFITMFYLARTCFYEGKTAEGVALHREMMEALLAHPSSELADPVLEALNLLSRPHRAQAGCAVGTGTQITCGSGAGKEIQGGWSNSRGYRRGECVAALSRGATPDAGAF